MILFSILALDLLQQNYSKSKSIFLFSFSALDLLLPQFGADYLIVAPLAIVCSRLIVCVSRYDGICTEEDLEPITLEMLAQGKYLLMVSTR